MYLLCLQLHPLDVLAISLLQYHYTMTTDGHKSDLTSQRAITLLPVSRHKARLLSTEERGHHIPAGAAWIGAVLIIGL